jgi:FkbM family methyltransferase
MIIKYGISNCNIDVTNICLANLTNDNIITIPSGDFNRAHYFGDPINDVLKQIFIIIDDIINEYEHIYTININILTNTITTINDNDINNKIANIHSNLTIKYGTFNEELPEQKMSVRYLVGNEKVLEIGGNIGRNTLVIASILENTANLVSLECNIPIAIQLEENKNINNLNFYIEKSALSNKKLIQCGWDTIPSNVLIPNYNWVNIINFNELQTKYNIIFDTLVLDCEGAFYYILMDMPEILNNINLIIMENDYHIMSHKLYVDEILKNNNFYRNYVESGGWGVCYNNFFEVWKKIKT